MTVYYTRISKGMLPIIYNSPPELMRFFGVSRPEFLEFWRSLSDDEKEYYRRVKL